MRDLLVGRALADRDIDLTRASASELDALRRDMDSPLWQSAAPGIRRVVEAAVGN